MPIRRCLPCSSVGTYKCSPGKTPGYRCLFNGLCCIYRVASAVSPGKELAFDTFWERGHELPPFEADNDSASVDFLLAVLSSPVKTVVKHFLSVVTEAVAVQIYKLLTSEQLDRVNARASGFGAVPAVYMALASLHCNVRVLPQPSEKTLKRLTLLHYLRKGRWEGLWGQEGGGSCRAFEALCESALL
eukprot:2475223-Pleurochrysis_carterae.AAC.1